MIFFYEQMSSLGCWLPLPLSSTAAGKEAEQLSFLGAFFSLSVFAEESVSTLDIIIMIMIIIIPISLVQSHIVFSAYWT